MQNGKKTIIINTDYPLLKTGLAKNGRELAFYLHKTGKYNIIYYACGMNWENADYQRLPFKCVGALPNNPQELEQLNRDQGLMRAWAYGLGYADRVVKEFKPDIFISSNDSWGVFHDKPYWNKIHCIPHITLDSLPFLDDQIKLIKASKQTFVWAEFAEKEAKKLGLNNVKTLTGIVRQDNCFKLSKQEKIDLRKKYNIPLDAFITGFVFRNQLRKELRPLMEGYSIFKKDNPQIKNTYLLLHTSINEGWNILKFCEEFNIPKEEILVTYICRHCGETEVKFINGNDLDCRFCGAQKSQITCNVSVGATEQQLNQIYNLMDCYCHLANAAGLEIPVIEALYTELPVATNGYASLETFTQQEFVYNIDFAWTVQLGTQFKRSAPYAISVAKFLKRISNMSVDDRAKIGKKGREWAISKFSPEVVCKQWEDYLDSLPPVDWDYNFEVEQKNPDAIIPEIKDDSEWVITLYREILKMTVDTQDAGYINWITNLKNGAKREDIHKFFVDVAQKENAKNQKPVDYSTLLLNNGKKNFLLVCPQSAGDILYATATLKSLRESYNKEEWNIYFACDSAFKELLEGCNYIDKVLDYQPFMESEIHCLGQGANKGLFQGYCFLTTDTQRHLSYLGNHKINLDLS